MKTGTKSLLYGAHWPLHNVMVVLAWKWLYGSWPTPKEAIAILMHDIGYFGSPNMDGTEGTMHPWVGDRIAKYLLGQEYADLIAGHSKGYSNIVGAKLSKLYGPDKVSHGLEAIWCYVLRTRLSGEIAEYRSREHGATALAQAPKGSDEEWFRVTRLRMVRAGIDHVLQQLEEDGQ